MISKHFSRDEFACKCGCGKDAVDIRLIELLEELREHYEVPVMINSGNRCFRYNKKVGGKPGSQHLLSKAADIQVTGIVPFEVYTTLDGWYPDKFGFGDYDTFTHVDVRDKKGRW